MPGFILLLCEFRVQFVRKDRKCGVHLLSADVGNDDHRRITLGIKPDVGRVRSMSATIGNPAALPATFSPGTTREVPISFRPAINKHRWRNLACGVMWNR